jgi:cell shape-determining protein MreC
MRWWEKLLIVMIVILVILIIFLVFNEEIFEAIKSFKAWYESDQDILKEILIFADICRRRGVN